jgi:hypothetical protein
MFLNNGTMFEFKLVKVLKVIYPLPTQIRVNSNLISGVNNK